MAKQESTKAIILRADSRGDEPPDLERKGAPLAPIASFNEYGSLVWNDEFYNKVQSLATPPKKKNLNDGLARQPPVRERPCVRPKRLR